ncbi:hypothetical protein U9R90_29925 [Streptomyces sp. E11-3]|uniref:hypothetical protein n=1 Tax=Streptomyces sp. E11-3 TaxID=3110112 RepID=UPI0039811E47
MAIAEDIRKAAADPKPLYFFAGTADIAYEQALKVPGLIEQLSAEAPAWVETVRKTDPKDVQQKAVARAKEAQDLVQNKVTGFIGTLDTDLKKIGDAVQDVALKGVGFAAEGVVKARETYDKVAERGEGAVKTWRGEPAEEQEKEKEELAAGEAEPVAVADEEPAAKKTATAKKTTAKKTTAKKTTSPAK